MTQVDRIIRDERELVSSFTFDASNRMVKGINERGEQSHYIFNGLGHLVAQEMIVERGAHGFGDVYAEPSPQVGGVVTFTRHRYDPVVSMYYARFRMYDASIRRFTAIDPIRGTVLMPHTMVQYTYVLNNPLNLIDP